MKSLEFKKNNNFRQITLQNCLNCKYCGSKKYEILDYPNSETFVKYICTVNNFSFKVDSQHTCDNFIKKI